MTAKQPAAATATAPRVQPSSLLQRKLPVSGAALAAGPAPRPLARSSSPLPPGEGPGVRAALPTTRSVLAPLLSAPITLQPKLTVNTPGDKYEQEADRVADMVMRMPMNAIGTSLLRKSDGQDIQKPCPNTLREMLSDAEGWRRYSDSGDPSVFHCGYTGFVEKRIPKDSPQNECFYDNEGLLVDDNHPFSGCKGTPNDYDAGEDPIKHGVIDKGGIVRAGLPAWLESRMHDFGSGLGRLDCSIRQLYGIPCTLQPKLTVNTPGDKYEQEADRVADMVMRMPDPMVSRSAAGAVPVTASDGKKNRVQRQCATCAAKGLTSEHCPDCKKKKQGLAGTLQRLSTQGDSAAGMAAPPIVSRVLSSPGSPLPADTRSFMESRFGTDFGHVRIHTDSLATESAAAVQAKAYTVGNHIAFGASHAQFGTRSGLHLLAHELSHVLQQTSGNETQVQRMRIAVPGSLPLCGKTLTHLHIEPPRAKPLQPCLPETTLVTRINIVGRDITTGTSPLGSMIFNLHVGYYLDPVTGKYCGVIDDARECISSRCKTVGCFPTVREVCYAVLAALAVFLIAAGLVAVAAQLSPVLLPLLLFG